jgi:quinol monooxygenase YgiN
MAHHYYVYYRVRREATDAARACVAELQAGIEREAGICGRALARCDEPELWMEVYEDVRDRTAFEATLSAAALASGLARHLEPGSARTVECFRD